ncbi:MAG TPA: hypothetical protein VGG72_27985 [Bryobacteraceae bacterium]|jgi:hypothetical protein
MSPEIERCRTDVAAIEAELLAGNPDVEGLVLALADWSAELRILHDENASAIGTTGRGDDSA